MKLFGINVIRLLYRYLEKKKVKYKSEPNTKAMYSTKINTQILSSQKSVLWILSQDQQILQSSKSLNKAVRYGCYRIIIQIPKCNFEIRT